MTRQRTYLPEWDWVYVVFYDTTRDSVGMIEDELQETGCTGELFDRAKRHLERTEVRGGLTFTNPARRTSVSVVSGIPGPEGLRESADIETGNAARHIAHALGLEDNQDECSHLRAAIAYSSGNIFRRMKKGTKNNVSSQF